MNFFTKPRIKPNHANNAPFTFVEGVIFIPGADVNAYEPTLADPIYTSPVPFPDRTFTPLVANQEGGLVWQGLAIPFNGFEGNLYEGMKNPGLISEDDYPDMQGDYYN